MRHAFDGSRNTGLRQYNVQSQATAVRSLSTCSGSQLVMASVNLPAPKEFVSAGLLVVGDEILSGRTKDKNIGYIAEYLTTLGIDLMEVRVVGDTESTIIEALNALRHRYT